MSAQFICRKSRWALAVACFGMVVSSVPSVAAESVERFDVLQSELGGLALRGEGIAISHIEAEERFGSYAPNAADPVFEDTELVDRSERAAPPSSHATVIADFLYGASGGLAPGIPRVLCYAASDWLGEGFLRAGDVLDLPPETESAWIQNHSWIGRLSADASLVEAIDVQRRLDYAIERDGFTAVVSLDNGAETDLPDLLAHCYNVISVGRADGVHSRGTTRYEGIGRTKPDLVGAAPATSLNVAAVSAAAAWLLEAIANDPALADAAYPESIKAILMSAASKNGLPAWTRSESRPLDPVFGAGLLDVYAAYHVLIAGNQPVGHEDPITPLGWSFDIVSPGAPGRYHLEVPRRTRLEDVSIVLAWNRSIRDSNPSAAFEPEAVVSNLDLAVFRAADDSLVELDASRSEVDNVEHVFQARLQPGRYVIEVTSDREQAYALAWNSRPMSVVLSRDDPM